MNAMYDSCSTECDSLLPEPKAAMRPGNTEIAQALKPWFNRIMRHRWGRRTATPRYRRSRN